MFELTSVLAWVFGIVCATIIFGSLIRRRREQLVDVLRDHVQKEIGPPKDSPTAAEAVPSATNEETT
jgi:hypothetical protein